MIPYRNITLQDVIDEVVIRATSTLRNGVNVDWSTLARFVNRAIKETAKVVMPFRPSLFINRIAITNGTQIPVTYIDTIRVQLSSTGNPPYIEARKVDVREFYEITNPLQPHSWNRDLNFSPVYFTWGGTGVVNPTAYFIYVFPNNYSGILEGHFIPGDITARGGIVPIPYEFIELVVLGALSRLYFHFNEQTLLQTTIEKLEAEKLSVLEEYAQRKIITNQQEGTFEQQPNKIVAQIIEQK